MWKRLVGCAIAGHVLGGCCGKEAPIWDPVEPVLLVDGSASVGLEGLVSDDKGDLTLVAQGDAWVIAEMRGDELQLTAQPGWTGETSVFVTALDGCDNASTTEIAVRAGSELDGGWCARVLSYVPVGSPDRVAIAGSFNDWSTDTHRLEQGADGAWTVELSLEPGSYPYKFVEIDEARFGEELHWTCDPAATLIQCDSGYKEPWDNSWAHVCKPDVASCNSLLVIPDCAPPRLEVLSLDVDRASGSVSFLVEATIGGAELTIATALLDGVPVEAGWNGTAFEGRLEGLLEGRHTIRMTVTDVDGFTSDEVYIPLWIDDWSWDEGVLYFAFVDRLANGSLANDASEGATATTGGFEGGDLAGVTALLPYLDDLGVNILWLSNMQDNAEGAWSGDCGATYAGYHAYWPDAPTSVEEHFGTEDELHELIDRAHARGMRVIVDWVGNHVHETHPYRAAHPEWFNALAVCKDSVDGQANWDRIPESCWFAPYLPDIDYSRPEPLTMMLDDALWWAKTYEFDGFRVDAVKHMPHAVSWNLASRIRDELEHRDAGGDERFWTVGETFDGYEKINAYIGDNQLSGQFDFPLYYALRGAFVTGDTDLPGLMAVTETSEATYGDALMSNFLGNHDVIRFISEAAEGDQSVCPDDMTMRVAEPPVDGWPYARMNLAWTWVFTQRAVPLVYYGDELGLPGYTDPDNRQPLWWYTGGDLAGVDSVDAMMSRVDALQALVLERVSGLANARADHPAMRHGETINWWSESEVYAFARSHDGDHMIALFNRTGESRELANGLSFAGLPTEGDWVDVVTGERFVARDDRITIDLNSNDSRVLVYE